ncbi:MAG: hypothetical protein ACRCTZ_03685 [Sarcina sp.]
MKKVFKLILLAIGVFWGTITILQAKASVVKYVSQYKKVQEIIEITDFISKKGDGFTKYTIDEISKIYTSIASITNEIKSTKDLEEINKDIIKLKDMNFALKEIISKKTFIGLENFGIKVGEFNILVDNYINFVEKELLKSGDFDIKMMEAKQKVVENIKIDIEELLKTLEVN